MQGLWMLIKRAFYGTIRTVFWHQIFNIISSSGNLESDYSEYR